METIIPNPGHRLLPGAFVTVRIAKGTVADQAPGPGLGSRFRRAARLTSGRRATVQDGGAATVYECAICHMHYTAAQAARFHYRDPMEGGKLVPLKNAASPASPGRTLTR